MTHESMPTPSTADDDDDGGDDDGDGVESPAKMIQVHHQSLYKTAVSSLHTRQEIEQLRCVCECMVWCE